MLECGDTAARDSYLAKINAASTAAARTSAAIEAGLFTCSICAQVCESGAKLAKHIQGAHPNATAQGLANCGVAKCPDPSCTTLYCLVTATDCSSRCHMYTHFKSFSGRYASGSHAAIERTAGSVTAMCHAAAAEARCLARPGTPGSMLTVGKGSSTAEARLAGGHATAAAAAAAIRSATKGADGAIRPADTLNTMPAADFDLSVM